MPMGVERRLLNVINKKYPRPLHEMLYDPLLKPTLAMEKRAENEKRLTQLLAHLPHWGIGRIVTTCDVDSKNITFWRITRVFVDHQTENFEYGLVWGVFTNKGRCNYYEEEIVDSNEHLWRLVPKYKEDYYVNFKPESQPIKEVPLYVPLPPLMSRIFKMQKSVELKKSVTDEPMVRFLFARTPYQPNRQKLDDGSLV